MMTMNGNFFAGNEEEAIKIAIEAAAISVTKRGAQPSIPLMNELISFNQ